MMWPSATTADHKRVTGRRLPRQTSSLNMPRRRSNPEWMLPY